MFASRKTVQKTKKNSRPVQVTDSASAYRFAPANFLCAFLVLAGNLNLDFSSLFLKGFSTLIFVKN